MAVQARALATYDTILRAAVEVFEEIGYGDAGQVDIIGRAGVTKGAFYYHFPTKESVAQAVLREGYDRIHALMLRTLRDPSSPALENMIRATFAVAEMIRSDPVVRVGHELRQALPAGREMPAPTPADRRATFIEAAERAIAEGDVLEDVDPEELSDLVRAAAVGVHVLVGTTADAVFPHLKRAWNIILRGIVPPESLPYFREFVARTAERHPGGVPAQTG